MQQAAIYARYSSDKQTEDSIEAQLRACREYAAAHGIQVVATYCDEAISGKGAATASRKQYQKLLRDCDKGGFSVILIHINTTGLHATLASTSTLNNVCAKKECS